MTPKMVSSEEEVKMPQMSMGRSRGARKSGKKKRKPKYRDMVIRAVKSLKEPKGSSYNSIARYIEERYKVRNDFVLKHVINWLCQKRVLSKKGVKVKLTGKTLKLGRKGVRRQTKKPSKKSKKAKKRRRGRK
ncbi:unnamed protein product [Clavelina lepadiformis]|uniref:H15 domain-containing protein n=1 Tax=Clavelina lepadiformis TaxID=159417 RepID=A0ABP0G9E6_CLALP